jgi:hypothetical protein
MATDILRQRTYHIEKTAANPQIHNVARRAGRAWLRLGATVEGRTAERACNDGCVKGWLTSFSAKYNPGFVPGKLGIQARWLPMPTKKEKGIRNLIDAASQSP